MAGVLLPAIPIQAARLAGVPMLAIREAVARSLDAQAAGALAAVVQGVDIRAADILAGDTGPAVTPAGIKDSTISLPLTVVASAAGLKAGGVFVCASGA